MENMHIYNLARNVPVEAQKPIGAGRLKGMTDINPMWRIKLLTEMFGPVGFGWYYKTINKWLDNGADGVIVANVEIELYVKQNDVWSMPIIGIGGSNLVAKESKGLYTSDEAYKMALTDAISIACKALGFAADIYFSKDRTKYDNPTDHTSKEYKCADCGKPFNDFTDKNGKKWTSAQVYHMAENANADKKARCKECKTKLEGANNNE